MDVNNLTGGILVERGIREKFVCEAIDVIKFKMCSCEGDLRDDENTFSPVYAHQVFGDNEVIFGYKGLKVNVYYTAGALKQYFKINYTEKVQVGGSVEADNILALLKGVTPGGYIDNEADFIREINNTFTPPGEMVFSYGQNNKRYEIFYATMADNKFREYHNHLQTFTLWYIDAANFIDDDDEAWVFYTLYERVECGGDTQYKSMGFLSAYHYFRYPCQKRPRISQVLMLPPYQREGHGAKLLKAMYDHSISNNDVYDITVEDPSDNFTRLRNFVDAKNCSDLMCFQPAQLKLGFDKEMVKEARERLKITALQARKIYEILRLRATDISNPEEYKQYRLDVKRRLNRPFQKEKKSMIKFKEWLSAEEYEAVMFTKSIENQHEFLDRSYKELERDYRKVIERLSAAS